MNIIPAIDIQDGKCVRLYKGRFDRATEYNDDPAEVARSFAELEVSDLHIVDLDGARTGTQANSDAIRRIAGTSPFEIQLGGGIRYTATVEHWFDNGVSRCVIGSLAIQEPERVKEWLSRFGTNRIVLALDVSLGPDGTPMIATHGWTRTSGHSLWKCLDDFTDNGIEHVLCTDISRDGAMTGPNVDLYSEIVQRYPSIQLQASGGVRNIDDLRELASHGITAAITGRALLDGAISQDEVVAFRQSA